MSVNLNVNGIAYQYPENGDVNWGTQATAWATAVSNSTLQKNGGTFALTADANFGSSFGIVAKYVKSQTGNAAAAGVLRLANADTIAFRNGANTADLPLAVVSDKLRFNGAEFVDTTSVQTLTNKDYVGTSLIIGGGTALTTTNATGTGNLVKATSPTLVTPALGVATATSLAIGGGTVISTSNATGTGDLVKATSPSLVTPALGVATATSLAIGGGSVITTSNATGTGNLVRATSPTLVSPTLGDATVTTVNNVEIAPAATYATLHLADTSSLTTVGGFDATLTFAATTNVTFPNAGNVLTDTSTNTVQFKTFKQTYDIQNSTKFAEFPDFFTDQLTSGLIPSTSASLVANIPSGVAYIRGTRVYLGITNKTWTASRDTYADLASTGAWTFIEVTNGAGAPAITANCMRIFSVVTNGTAVTTVNQLKTANTSFGLNALPVVTTGYDNIAVGQLAGTALTTGFSNALFGVEAGTAIIGGYENVCFGPYAGNTMTSGFSNICVGAESGSGIIGANSNILIGKAAGVTGTPANAITSGSNCVFIGANAGYGSATQRANAIGIGDAVTVSAANAWTIGKLGTVQYIKEGANGAMGVSTLVAGTVTVSNTKVTANSRIFLSTNTSGGTVGHPYISARTAGTSFTITSTSGTDTSTIAWEIKEPA